MIKKNNSHPLLEQQSCYARVWSQLLVKQAQAFPLHLIKISQSNGAHCSEIRVFWLAPPSAWKMLKTLFGCECLTVYARTMENSDIFAQAGQSRLSESIRAPQFTPLSHFLLHQFGPHDLLSSSTPLLLETHHNALTFLPNHTVDDDYHLHNHKLKNAALEAANKSHAPYTASPSSVALLNRDGIFTKALTWNPSLLIPASALSSCKRGGDGSAVVNLNCRQLAHGGSMGYGVAMATCCKEHGEAVAADNGGT
ncbi:cytidine deaminase [Vigna unguiculata]|uniref:Cytidine deaminase n=1 Tax=Vigna unguiculata TaxID=3917 RepID=A0A4D6L6T4_VIGUN|nr:cytidine deaminase [Vigna unguiculata]